jgi:hypothetical protein
MEEIKLGFIKISLIVVGTGMRLLGLCAQKAAILLSRTLKVATYISRIFENGE